MAVDGRQRMAPGDANVAYWPITSFTALQKGGRYRINSGQTAPSGLTSSAAFDPQRTWTEQRKKVSPLA
jgi:hypothetical protein